mmetsp:Transcript_18565/g.38843  ORF Transcript_18565/g.38843 Transcript_18565/m.38843 type:complete len:378 (-) Transcript_18565:1288-2421(-)
MEVMKLAPLLVIVGHGLQVWHLVLNPIFPILQVLGNLLAQIRAAICRIHLDGIHEIPHLFSEEVGIWIGRPRTHVQQSNTPEKQRPFSGADLPSMTLQGSSDEEAAGQFVVLKQASANVLKDAVQDLVAQVGHADVDVITLGRFVHACLEKPHEVEQAELVHGIDVGQIRNDKVEDASTCCHLCVLLTGSINLHRGFFGGLHSLIHRCGGLFGLPKGADEHLIIENVATGLREKLQDLVFQLFQHLLIICQLQHQLNPPLQSCWDFFGNHLIQQLLFQALERDGDVDDRHLDANFWEVVWIGHLCCHVEEEVLVVIHLTVSQLDLQSIVVFIHCLQQHRFQGWVQGLFNVLHQHGSPGANATFQDQKHLGIRHLQGL